MERTPSPVIVGVANGQQRKIAFIPSNANMFMVNWNLPARHVKEQYATQGVDIGRSWPIWPNMSRITVGSADEMKKFCAATDRVFA